MLLAVFSLFLFAFVSSTASDQVNNTAVNLDADRVALFFQTIDEELARRNIRGAAYAFRGPGMEAPLLGAYGKVSGSPYAEPVDTDTAFMLASISKPFVGATMAVLIDQGRLDLDDDICSVLGGPTLKGGAINTACRNPFFPTTNVTWRMLINHRSSIKRSVPDPDNATAVYGPTGEMYPFHVGNPECPIDDTKQFFEDLFVNKPTETTVGNIGYSVNWYQLAQDAMGGVWSEDYGPGERREYSNIAPAYIAALIERLTGEKFEELSATSVFAPAGMNSTAWFRRDLPNNTLEAVPLYPYDEASGTWEPWGHYCFADYANGQLHSTISDMAAYADLMLSYGIGTLWSNTTAFDHVFGCQEKDESGNILGDDDCIYALSWNHLSNTVRDFHGEDTSLDWTNGIQHNGLDYGVATDAVILPEANTYVIVLLNTDGGDAFYFMDAILAEGIALLNGEPPVGAASRGGDQRFLRRNAHVEEDIPGPSPQTTGAPPRHHHHRPSYSIVSEAG
ncbi:beta-lactamase [Seminavis robusta]|uniref:Beta-lactamase n=1 Tax=Seminavis robusta TaxID=568900 RepID=A0A9N8EQ61_9STRA|nr:beta-lactamase [Seminavis robusta]|eukprot:Sro1756_g295620.1 beta-lactamase (507) ;mRNA; r:9191-10933